LANTIVPRRRDNEKHGVVEDERMEETDEMIQTA
jgi:hypothetical protein